MKKVILLVTALLFIVPAAFALDFAPTVLTLSAPPVIQYGFNATQLKIPISVQRTPANMVLMIYTKDQAAAIPTVTNGYLGWHTVNKIDTCIYWDAVGQFNIGNHDISWDGNDQDGNAVPAGEYIYYLFGYDNVNLKTAASPFMCVSWHNIIINDHDPVTGNPLVHPWMDGDDTQDRSGGTGTTRGRWKWTVGNDPSDLSLIETTNYDMQWVERKSVVWSPYVAGNFYTLSDDSEAGVNIVRQFKWVPNGESTQIEDWGDQGTFTYSTNVTSFQVFAYVGDDILVCGNSNFSGGDPYTSEMILVGAAEGEEMSRLDISEWWVDIAGEEAGGQANGWPSQHDVQDGNLIMGAWTTCIHQVIKPSAGADDFNVWINDNGDYIGDHNFKEDANMPWVCNDYNVAPYMYSINLDSNMFSAFPCFDMGAVSFGLMGPDGTGIDYFAFAGETAAGKVCTEMVNYGSAYDGIYTDNFSDQTEGVDVRQHIWYVGYDSIKGVITNKVGVDDEAPAALDVAQNSPNPFNPSTTISFATADAGNVTIDVFNVAGQKVDTIVSEFMNAGSHSVVWDASEFSAGVYFYTVRCSEFSKTLKMTLLK